MRLKFVYIIADDPNDTGNGQFPQSISNRGCGAADNMSLQVCDSEIRVD